MTLTGIDTNVAIDLNKLYTLRHHGVIEAEVRMRELDALSRRIKAGEQKIEEARAALAPPAVLDAADLRLAGLHDQLHELKLRYLVPAELLDNFYAIAESLTKQGLPEHSYISVVIPGYMTLCVSVDDANEAPF